ncbi:contractile injection system protein, VgrG/Pvc8 family [Novosphingobium colocasiae]
MTPGLIDKGRFTVDEVEAGGYPDQVTITARSADLSGKYRQRRTKVWKDTTLGAVLADIAARHGITARVHPDLAGKPIAAIDQHGKSDMAFVRDLGSRYDAVATWKDRKLIFIPVGSATTAGGKAIPALSLTRRDGWAWRFTRADRDENDGAEAQWHDQAAGRRKKVSTGGKNPKKS